MLQAHYSISYIFISEFVIPSWISMSEGWLEDWKKYVEKKPVFDLSKVAKWSEVKVYDLSQPLSNLTPPFPTYPPFEFKWIKTMAENNVQAQYIMTPLHIGTHMDGPLHFVPSGPDIGSIPIEHWVGEGVIVDVSDEVGELGIYTSEMVQKKAKEHNLELKPGDILIIHTGYHKYAWYQPGADTVRYMLKHPGPTVEFAKWVIKSKFRWLAVDATSQDHPLNTVIRKVRPDIVEEFEKIHGKKIDELMPWPENYQVMHILPFKYGIVHVENAGGEISQIKNRRCLIVGAPFKFIGGESAFTRLLAICGE